MIEQLPNGETLVEIHGYVTDPKQVGYQILNNYENLYWATLVGPIAWRLYELLRGFCHGDNNTVETTISFLTAALGLDDKRALTGRVKRVKGKEYFYPGFIEILQTQQLIIAEEVWNGPAMSYRFHINRTPGLLTDEQVTHLPEVIRRNHVAFLRRHEEKIRLLEAKKRTSKITPLQKGRPDAETGGEGNSHGGEGISHGGGGKFPPKQQQLNNTENNNTRGENTAEDVVAFFNEIGIEEKVSQRLIEHYSLERLRQKIEYLRYLQEHKQKEVTSPAGWLRKAIEEDYAPPAGYKPKPEREAEAAAREQRKRETDQAIEAQEQRDRPAQSWQDWIVQTQNISIDLMDLTILLRESLRKALPDTVYNTWSRQLMLLELSGNVARLAVPSPPARTALLDHRSVLDLALSQLLKHPVTASLEVVKQPLE